MRIYAAADIHGKIDRLYKIIDTIGKTAPDILILAGDIFNYRINKEVCDLLSTIQIPILGVRGNSDPVFIKNRIKRKINIRFLRPSPWKKDNFNFIGFNGTIMLPFISKIRLFESGLITKAASCRLKDTILVAHPPPRGYCDRTAGRFHAGSPGLKNLLKTNSPLMVVCGHIHEQAGVEYYEHTPIINCAMNKMYGGAIIDCDKEVSVKIRMIMN